MNRRGMRRYAFWICISVVALVALGVAPPGWGVENGPFSTKGIYQIVAVEGNPWAHHEITAEGSGQGNHVGHFTAVVQAVAKGNGEALGVETMTATDGDVLYIENHTVLDAMARVGTFTIIGGTGKFEGATGSGNVVNVPLGGELSEVTREGTISY